MEKLLFKDVEGGYYLSAGQTITVGETKYTGPAYVGYVQNAFSPYQATTFFVVVRWSMEEDGFPQGVLTAYCMSQLEKDLAGCPGYVEAGNWTFGGAGLAP